MALRLRGAQVFGLDVVDANSARPQWLAHIGGNYLDGRKIAAGQVQSAVGCIDLILEATGVASLEFNLLDALGQNGVYVLTGIPGGERPIQIPGAELLRQLVLKNQLMLGSVNAARDHFQLAANDLAQSRLLWGDHVDKLITNRHRYNDFEAALHHHSADDIKTVIEWDGA
jgi:threonine dehydrogenase-like Zn-dependent dehydrogenase